MPRVVIAGGGVAALEAALALRAHLEGSVEVELIGPEPHFWYRPLSVAEPFNLGEARHYDLSSLAREAGATFTHGELRGIDASARQAITSNGPIPYDILLVATGARPVPAVPGALTFRGPADAGSMSTVLAEAVAGEVHRIAFVVPSGATWALPAYELALMTATHLSRRDVEPVRILLVTPEPEPLGLFGGAGSEAVSSLLAAQEIQFVPYAAATEFHHGVLQLEPEGGIPCDRVVALPRLRGPRIDGVPQTLDGFIPVDPHGRVTGLNDVYAAGDITTFPVKQGGIAAQLADAAAQAIAARLGADLVPQPFHPILRGMLLTGGAPRYLRRELGAPDESATASPEPLWWPATKIVGRYLSPYLASLAGDDEPTTEPTGAETLEIEVALTDAVLDRLAATPDEPAAFDGETVGDAMSTELLVVAPEDTLGEIAERMQRADTGCAVVAHYGRLVGILTSRDLLGAFAARVHPSEARAREWMTADPIAAPASLGIERAVARMDGHGIHHLPVVDGDRPIGMLGYRQAVRRRQLAGVGLGF